MEKVKYDNANGTVERRFTPEWSRGGIIDVDNVPKLIDSIVSQRREMITYIEVLHNELDRIIKLNNLCELCHMANCTSDHK